MANSKVIYNGQVLIDLTGDTVTAEKLLTGYTAHGADGEVVTGACSYDVNSAGASATPASILAGKTAGVKGTLVVGTMTNNGAVTGTIEKRGAVYVIPQGYHDGSGKVAISSTEQAKIIAANIREGVTILGITGNMTGTEDAVAETITVTPTASEQTILPNSDEGYNYIAQVTVAAIPYTETENEAGGMTVTIG